MQTEGHHIAERSHRQQDHLMIKKGFVPCFKRLAEYGQTRMFSKT